MKRARAVGLLVGAGALLVASIAVRADGDGPHLDARDDDADADPRTGAVVVDLLDDDDAGDRAEVVGRLVHAIAPFSWRAGLGTELEHDAELYRLTPPASEVADVLAALRDDPNVESVEVERTWAVPLAEESAVSPPNRAPAPARGPFKPNDPYYRYQWHMDAIGMPAAWAEQRGRGAVVAVIDTGVLYREHGRFHRAPDLADTRFVAGHDFVDGDATPDDEHGHGTHCAGTVAQSTNNGLGVAGVAPDAAIMPIRVLDARGSGGYGSVAAGIRWAADHGANVISMSLGGSSRSSVVDRAVQHAHARGVTVIAAAGNAARARVEYPAGYDHVISVGAVRYDGELSFYSSYGKGLDLVAPGGDLRVDQNGDGMPDGVLQNTMVRGDPSRMDYLAWQGTSMATPHVAGVAALLYASGVHDPATIESLLVESARSRGDVNRYGAGLVQASAALRLADEGAGALRGLAALALSLGTLLTLRRRGALAVALPTPTAVAFVVAGGLSVLPLHFVLGAGAESAVRGVPELLAAAGGRYLAPVALSVLLPFGAMALLLSVPRARPWLVGLSLGVAASLLVEALLPMAEIALPGRMLVGPWLLANAAVAVVLARVVARRVPGERPAIE